MNYIAFYMRATFFVFLSLPCFAIEYEINLNDKITELLRPNWPYQAFLAIPRIEEIKPILAIEISGKRESPNLYNCIELHYLKQRKKFEPKAILDRKSLHELLCKAMKRAVQNTDSFLLLDYFKSYDEMALQFDFFSGNVKTVDIPYPPLGPFENLENLFLDENEVLNFGDIDLPKEFELEISQTPL